MFIGKKIRRIVFAILVLGVCQGAFGLSVSAGGNEETFLSIADIHFTPFTDCKAPRFSACPEIKDLMRADVSEWEHVFAKYPQTVSHYGQDTNFALLQSSLADIKRIAQQRKPRFTLLLGDFLGHNFREQYMLYAHDSTQAGYDRFIKKTLQFLTQEIRQAIPEGDIYASVGNNDSYTGDYSVVPSGKFLHDTAKIWSSFIKNAENLKAFQTTFPLGGYYAVTSATNPRLKIIVLDTVLFSSRAPVYKRSIAANNELAWLKSELTKAKANGQRVFLAFHIPLGVDVYKTIQNVFGGVTEFWRSDFSAQFKQILEAFPGTVVAILPGHIHMDTFQMLSMKKVEDVPITYTPSISPIFGNNPAFKIYSFDANSLQINDFETYYFPLNHAEKGWLKEYSFRSAYFSNCSHCDMNQRIHEVLKKLTLLKTYKELYAVGKNSQPIAEDTHWQHYWCNIHPLDASDYLSCLKGA